MNEKHKQGFSQIKDEFPLLFQNIDLEDLYLVDDDILTQAKIEIKKSSNAAFFITCLNSAVIESKKLSLPSYALLSYEPLATTLHSMFSSLNAKLEQQSAQLEQQNAKIDAKLEQ